jgi:hypothetical protein
MTTVVTLQQGGTGANSAAAARVSLGAAPTAAYDQANNAYLQANNAFPTTNIITSNVVTAIKANHYILKNTSATTLTLPASPSTGDLVWVTIGNGLNTNIIGRNGSLIRGLAEDMTVNIANTTLQLRYIDSTLGWQLC